MTRRERHADRRTLGRSARVPFDPTEAAADRHWRRYGSAAEAQAEVESWCRRRGVSLRVLNRRQHWQFRIKTPGGARHLAEWWPSSAKLVFDQRWARGVHCHDVDQVRAEISRRWKL